MKNLLNLEGIKTLSRNEQKAIGGGTMYCPPCAQIGALGCRLSLCTEGEG